MPATSETTPDTRTAPAVATISEVPVHPEPVSHDVPVPDPGPPIVPAETYPSAVSYMTMAPSGLSLAAKKITPPTLTNPDRIWEWVAAFERVTRLSDPPDTTPTHQPWSILAIQCISESGVDSLLSQLRIGLENYPWEELTFIPVYSCESDGSPRPPAVLDHIARRSVPHGSRDLGAGMGPFIGVNRPTFVWEWLTQFFNTIWLDHDKRATYKLQLDALRFFAPPQVEGIAVQEVALSVHDTLVQRLLKLAVVRDPEDSLGYFKASFRGDRALHKEALQARTWTEIYKNVLSHLRARYESLLAPDLAAPRVAELGLNAAHITSIVGELRKLGYNITQPGPRQSGPRPPGQARPVPRAAIGARPRSSLDPAFPLANRACYHCNKIGHLRSECKSRKRGVPGVHTNPPRNMSWRAHVQAMPAAPIVAPTVPAPPAIPAPVL